MADFDPHKLTWAALLGRWVTFARSAVALPDDAQGRAWKGAVPHIIGLQAVTMALGEADQLAPDQRALGLDRARVLIERHTTALDMLFDGQTMHSMLRELIDDARTAVAKVQMMSLDG